MKVLLWGIMLGVAGWAAAATAAEIAPPAGLIDPGKLVYGSAATYPPFEFMENGKFTGFDIDMADLLAGKMGLKAEIVPMEFKGLIPALQSKRIDLINSGMYVNEERKQVFDFIPYLRLGQEIVVKKSNPSGIKSRADLCGKKVAVTLGAMQETYARQDKKRCDEAGKPTVDVLTFPTAQDSVLSILQGRADALFITTPGALKLVADRPDDLAITGETFEANTIIAMGVRKDETDVKRALQQTLAAARADGSFAKIMAKYGFAPRMMYSE